MNFPEVLLTRRSIRRYRQLPVPDEDLRFLLEAARLAACATNRQILRFIVARTPGQVAALLPLTAWAALVSPRRSPKLDISAPAAFIAVTAPDGVTPELTQADAGAAIQSMLFAAVERGLGGCWLGAIQREKVAEVLQLPADQKVLYLLAVGYPDETPCTEDASTPGQTKYYLDDHDQLHVPKLTIDQLATWR